MQTVPLLVILAAVLILPVPATAQETAVEELAKQSQNPVANMISQPLQNNTTFDWGPKDQTRNVLNVQPVWPFEMTDDWNLITRTIIPIISQPGTIPGEDRENGLGDTTFTAFASPSKPSKLTWGVGPVVLIPTATDDRLGADSWGLGASVILLTMPGPWVIGSLFSQVWDVSGDTNIDLFSWQYFLNYNFPSGWYLTSAPIITRNGAADSKDRWTVPFGGGAGKVFLIGKQPINASLQFFYNAEKPQHEGDWQMRFQWTFLFPRG